MMKCLESVTSLRVISTHQSVAIIQKKQKISNYELSNFVVIQLFLLESKKRRKVNDKENKKPSQKKEDRYVWKKSMEKKLLLN